jgi:broad specificity phosphatase PhoE
VEVRRHAPRGPDGLLTPAGWALASRVGQTLHRPYAAVLTGTASRCIQTARAFGFSNFRIDPAFDSPPAEALGALLPQIRRAAQDRVLTLLEAFLRVPATRDLLFEAGERLLGALRHVADRLPAGGRALAITHTGSIEPAILLAAGAYGGGPVEFLRECEGAAFAIDRTEVVGVTPLSLPPDVLSHRPSGPAA